MSMRKYLPLQNHFLPSEPFQRLYEFAPQRAYPPPYRGLNEPER